MIERKRRPTSKNTQQPNQSPKEQVQKSNTSHAEEACRLRAGRRAIRVPRDTLLCASRDARFCAPGARRSARRERAVLRAVSAPFSAPGDAPFCAPEDARAARRETCRGAPCARRVRAACARGAGRSGLSLLAQVSQSSAVGRAAGGRRHARRGPQVRRASPAHLRALARLEPKPGRKEVPPGFAVRFQRQKKAKRSTQRRRDGSGVRRARVQEPTAVESS